MTTTVGALIERARGHHPSFKVENHSNRVALSFLSTRHRELLKILADDLVDRLSEARNIADTIDNSLVGVDSDGNAYTVTTDGDGYDVILDTDTAVTITSSAAVSPALILAYAHGLVTLDAVLIAGHDGSADDDAVNAYHQVTVLDANQFTIPVDLSGGGGSGGTVSKIENLYTGPTAIAVDPYSDGFPLPVDSIKIVSVYAVLTGSERYRPIVVVPQRDIAVRDGSANHLYAIINGWRLVPIENPPSNTGSSRWDNVSSVTITWIDQPVRFTETGSWQAQTFELPDLYVDALEFELAAFFGRRDESAVPSGLATALDREATRGMEMAVAGAKRDHRSMKFRQIRRNR